MQDLFERYVTSWLALEVPDLHVQRHHRVPLGAGLYCDIDIVLRHGAGGRPLAVLDTKYKDEPVPSARDIQQVVFYATVLGCPEACLIYPCSVKPLTVRAGAVTVRTRGVDLSSLPLDPAPFRRWTQDLIAGSWTSEATWRA